MRRRVLLPLLMFGIIAVVAVALAIGVTIADSRTRQLALERTAALEQIVQRARTSLVQGDEASLRRYLDRFHAVYGESVLVLDDRGHLAAEAGDLSIDNRVAAVAAAAARSLPQLSLPNLTPWVQDTALVAVPVIGAGDLTAGVVILKVELASARADVTRNWIVVGVVGSLILTALMTASSWWTHWILRPVQALDSAVAALSAHRSPEPTRLSGPPELRRLSSAFATMAEEVENTLEQQRGFVADASHQLRNPLAAIRLRVDGLTDSASDGAELDAVQADLDRLEHTVTRMLVLADAEHRASAHIQGLDTAVSGGASRFCEVSAVRLAERHRARLVAGGLTLVADDEAEITIPCGLSDLEEIIDVVLDNAAKYAGDGTTVWVRLEESTEAIRLTIEDSGAGLTSDDLHKIGTRFWRSSKHSMAPGTGLGLAIVMQLMNASSGETTFDRSSYGGLRVRLTWSS